ncbi:MAG: acetyl-CoA carboxylase biotin carboxyl carrier protein subunit [Coprothermobacterota bacterium]|nr:acetyl-CoA carboxylase biotin carboxyl carrier protein subunit [Coprothermobacterota bacterium]
MTRKYVIKVNNKPYEVEVTEVGRTPNAPLPPAPLPPVVVASALPAQRVSMPMPGGPPPPPTSKTPSGLTAPGRAFSEKVVQAPMTGTIIKILCRVGQEVNEGDVILKLEAMKMETEMAAPFPGRVKEIRVAERQNVTAGDALVVME